MDKPNYFRDEVFDLESKLITKEVDYFVNSEFELISNAFEIRIVMLECRMRIANLKR